MRKPVWHGAGLHKAQPLIQVACVKVVFNHRVKQQNTKPVPLCLRETIENQFFTNVPAAAADAVGMQDIKPNNVSAAVRNAAIGLRSKKGRACLIVKLPLLRKSFAILYNLVPDANHGREIFFRIGSDFHNRGFS